MTTGSTQDLAGFEKISDLVDILEENDKTWFKHRTHIMLIRMTERLDEQKKELASKLDARHELVRTTEASLVKMKRFQQWFYKKFALNKYFDLDAYIATRLQQLNAQNAKKDRNKIEAAFECVLDNYLPKFLGLGIKTFYVSEAAEAPPDANLTVTVESGSARASTTTGLKISRPIHLQVPLTGETPMKFTLDGFRKDETRCDFVNFLAANNLITWIGLVGIGFEVRLWPDKDLEQTYAHTAK